MKFIPCEKCSKDNRLTRMPGFYMEFGYAVECECHKRWCKEGLLRCKMNKANISDDILLYTINNHTGDDNIKKGLDTYLSQLSDFKDKSIYLHGESGTGKTTIGQWLGLNLLNKNFTVKYITMSELSNVIHNFDNKKEVDDLSKLDYLIIDDCFDIDKMKVYKDSKLTYIQLNCFISNRLSHNKPIIFLSKISLKNIDVSVPDFEGIKYEIGYKCISGKLESKQFFEEVNFEDIL